MLMRVSEEGKPTMRRYSGKDMAAAVGVMRLRAPDSALCVGSERLSRASALSSEHITRCSARAGRLRA